LGPNSLLILFILFIGKYFFWYFCYVSVSKEQRVNKQVDLGDYLGVVPAIVAGWIYSVLVWLGFVLFFVWEGHCQFFAFVFAFICEVFILVGFCSTWNSFVLLVL
jgi:hypothetical protein